jgi:hypothetical protein
VGRPLARSDPADGCYNGNSNGLVDAEEAVGRPRSGPGVPLVRVAPPPTTAHMEISRDSDPVMDDEDGCTHRDGCLESFPTAVADGDMERRCAHCGARSTPEWRRGPTGRGTLCNAYASIPFLFDDLD